MRKTAKKLLVTPSKKTHIQLFRHILSGGVAFSFDVSLLYILTEFVHVHYLLATIMGFSVGLIITYLLSILWIFDERQKENKSIEIIIFIFIGIIGLAFTSFFMWLFTSVLMLHYLFSKVFTTVIVFVWNFVAKKKILFTKKQQQMPRQV